MIDDIMTRVLVDSRATHNFLYERKATQSSIGLARQVKTWMGVWEDKLNFLVLQMDDFDIILGADFTIKAKIGIFLHYNDLIICGGDQSYFVQGAM
ncbi:unnamed protein product [Spirodela intermedia]|uniref:Uncharacterized protein n=1 Tax=Spirodela intermedia TaxID=51605 RepID=A0A7I8JCD7_SPIIN|nr:unnamed protein product [Spirodela intermedia]CAA6667814.1 unnamed protein product [Spirodela intermedia]